MEQFPTVEWVRAEMDKRAQEEQKARLELLTPIVAEVMNKLAAQLRETLAFPVSAPFDPSLSLGDLEYVGEKVIENLGTLGYDANWEHTWGKNAKVTIEGFFVDEEESDYDED